jgi:hypothetical protein
MAEAEAILQCDRSRGQLTVWIRNLKFEGRGMADLNSSGTRISVRGEEEGETGDAPCELCPS